jgi:hypothetical protein
MKYTLMHKELPVADIEIDESTNGISGIDTVYNGEHLPFGVTDHNNRVGAAFLNDWWIGRGIPASRLGLREALGLLGIEHSQKLLIKGFGLSLSDQYWVCPKDKDLTWQDINFFNNDFSSDVGNTLFGSVKGTKEINFISPDNTSDGWLMKKWVINEGRRMLIKSGSRPYRQEPFNEVMVSALCRRMNIPHIEYTLVLNQEEPLSACNNFVDRDTELISAWRIMLTETIKKPDSRYVHFNICCKNLGIKNMKDYLNKMLTLDYIIANTDRHFNNFGVIRNAESLEWVGPAPIFDSGTSLWHDAEIGIDKIGAGNKNKSKPFRSTHREQIKMVNDFTWLDFNALRGIDDEFEDILKKNNYIRKERRDILCSAVRDRVKELHEVVMRRSRKVSSEYDEYGR